MLEDHSLACSDDEDPELRVNMPELQPYLDTMSDSILSIHSLSVEPSKLIPNSSILLSRDALYG